LSILAETQARDSRLRRSSRSPLERPPRKRKMMNFISPQLYLNLYPKRRRKMRMMMT